MRPATIGFFYSSFATILQKVFVLDNFSANESLLKVCMDNAGALRSFPAFFIRPGTYFLYTGSEVSLQVQQAVG